MDRLALGEKERVLFARRLFRSQPLYCLARRTGLVCHPQSQHRTLCLLVRGDVDRKSFPERFWVVRVCSQSVFQLRSRLCIAYVGDFQVAGVKYNFRRARKIGPLASVSSSYL